MHQGNDIEREHGGVMGDVVDQLEFLDENLQDGLREDPMVFEGVEDLQLQINEAALDAFVLAFLDIDMKKNN